MWVSLNLQCIYLMMVRCNPKSANKNILRDIWLMQRIHILWENFFTIFYLLFMPYKFSFVKIAVFRIVSYVFLISFPTSYQSRHLFLFHINILVSFLFHTCMYFLIKVVLIFYFLLKASSAYAVLRILAV